MIVEAMHFAEPKNVIPSDNLSNFFLNFDSGRS